MKKWEMQGERWFNAGIKETEVVERCFTLTTADQV